MSPDSTDLLRCLNDANAEYLVVGAHAVMHYTEPRYTKDLDIWVRPTPANSQHVLSALRTFGAPLGGVTSDVFTDPDAIFQIGVEPVRIDVLMSIDGVDFESAWTNRTPVAIGHVNTFLMSLDDLITAKRAAGRPQDLLDLARLELARANRGRYS